MKLIIKKQLEANASTQSADSSDNWKFFYYQEVKPSKNAVEDA